MFQEEQEVVGLKQRLVDAIDELDFIETALELLIVEWLRGQGRALVEQVLEDLAGTTFFDIIYHSIE